MAFCPDCKSLVYPDAKSRELYCRKCEKPVGDAVVGGARVVRQQANDKEMLVLDESSRQIETRGSVATECPKCGHGKAYAEFRQTRKSDEPPTMFCECMKCKHRWRQY